MAYLKPASECNCGVCPGNSPPKTYMGQLAVGGWVCQCQCHFVPKLPIDEPNPLEKGEK